jgi:transcriptional regulator with XRE-family HTH domain
MKVLGRWAKQGRSMRKVREQCGLKPSAVVREVERFCQCKTGDPCHVSRTYLQDIELGKCVPGIHKLKALAAVYQRNPKLLFKFYEIDLEEGGKLFTPWPSSSDPDGRPVIGHEEELRVVWEVTSRFGSTKTKPLAVSQEREVIPTRWREFLPSNVVFALIGTEDDSMGELLPAGCLAAVDTQQKTLDEGPWSTPAERSIYLVFQDDVHFHVCRFAYQAGNMLTLLPYLPDENHQVSHKKTPAEAEIVGRVIRAWRLARDDVPQASITPDEKPKTGPS